MSDNNQPLPSMALINSYVGALCRQDNGAMQALRAETFVLDWVHNDAFADQPMTRQQTSQFWPAWFTAFPEMDYHVTRTIAAEQVVVTQWTFTGTQQNPLGPPVFEPAQPSSGKTVRIRGVSIYDLHQGLIQRETIYIDLATLFVELGVAL